jgi:hypothetical protein
MNKAEQVYRLWHDQFRTWYVPWKQLSPANRAKWIAFSRKARKILQ